MTRSRRPMPVSREPAVDPVDPWCRCPFDVNGRRPLSAPGFATWPGGAGTVRVCAVCGHAVEPVPFSVEGSFTPRRLDAAKPTEVL